MNELIHLRRAFVSVLLLVCILLLGACSPDREIDTGETGSTGQQPSQIAAAPKAEKPDIQVVSVPGGTMPLQLNNVATVNPFMIGKYEDISPADVRDRVIQTRHHHELHTGS